MTKAERFHDNATDSLLSAVDKMNEIDVDGPQEVNVVEFANGWQLIDSLSTGQQYFHKPAQSKELKSQTSRRIPAECKEESKVREERTQPQGSTFAKPPDPLLYSPKLESIPVVTNAYLVSGDFLRNTVHTYLVEFSPPLMNQEVLERRRAVIGVTQSRQRANRRLLERKFGHWTFNNNSLYSIAAPAHKNGPNDELALSDTYRVSFRWQDSSTINSTDLELTEEEQLLNTFNKKAMKDAGFKQVRRSWFYHDVTSPPKDCGLDGIRPTRINNQCTILHGFDCRMTLSNGDANDTKQGKDSSLGELKQGVFKCDLANKQISTKTVHQIVADIRDDCGGSKSARFQAELDKQLKGKFFIMSYNSNSQRIESIDLSENEHSTFTNRHGARVSYGNYLTTTYGVAVKRKEQCVLKDRRGSAFLPQFAYLTLRSDEIEQDLREAIQQHTNPPIDEQLRRVDGLVRCLNRAAVDSKNGRGRRNGNGNANNNQNQQKKRKRRRGGRKNEPNSDEQQTQTQQNQSEKSKKDDDEKQSPTDANQTQKETETEAEEAEQEVSYGLHISPQCVTTRAVVLNYPTITYKAFGGREKTVTLHPETFRWGGREGTKGFLEDTIVVKKWTILADNARAIATVEGVYEQYLRMRGFDETNPPLLPPSRLIMDFAAFDSGDNKEKEKLRALIRSRPQLIFVCLPNDAFGSEVKTRLTKALQSAKQCKANGGCLLQCMQQSTLFMPPKRAKDAILGAIEQMMGKIGNILYRITPSIPPASAYHNKLERIWTIGIDISHGGLGMTAPSVAMLCLQTLPFCGTQRGLRNFTWLNSARKDVIPYAATATMTIKALTAEMALIRDERTRPEIIMVFRDGAPDNALKEIHSKELVGVQRGVYEVRAQLKEEHGVVWKPKIQFIVVSKDPIERFGVVELNKDTKQREKVVALRKPCVVHSGITNNKLWDFFIWGFHPNSHIDKIKPKRFVVLRDELKLGVLRETEKAKESEEVTVSGSSKGRNKKKGKGKAGSSKAKVKVVNSKRVQRGAPGSNGPMGLYEIIYALSFTYHPSLPFIQGGTSQPAPITFAKHFAEKFSQLITAKDVKLHDLKLSKNLENQPQIVTNLLDLPQKLPGNKGSSAAVKKQQHTAKASASTRAADRKSVV